MPDAKTADRQDQENRLTAALSEYRMLRQSMLLFTDNQRKDIQMLVGALTVLMTVYFSNTALVDVHVITLIIPSLVFIFYMLQASNLYQVAAFGKATRRIEKRINKLVGAVVMDWDSVVAPQTSSAPVSVASLVITTVSIFVVCIFVFFSIRASQAFGCLWLALHGLELVLMLGTTLWWALFALTADLK